MNKKRIAQAQLTQRELNDRQDPRNSLLVCAILIFSINFLCSFILSELYSTMQSLVINYSVDIEKNGTLVHTLCKIGAPVLFYLNSFLGTAAFFIGTAYICRFAFFKKKGKCASAALILAIAMFATNIIALCILFIRRLSGEYIRLSDPSALVFDFVFLILRVFIIWAVANRLSERKARIRSYALFSAVFMLACALLLEFANNTLPYLLTGKAQAEDYVTMLFSYLLYIIHAIVGYIIVKKFLEKRERSPKEQQKENIGTL